MAIKIRNILKSFFKTGEKPTEQQFGDVLDSYAHLQEDAQRLLPGGGATGAIPIKQPDGSAVWVAPEDAFPEVAQATETANAATDTANNAQQTASAAYDAASAASTKANAANGTANASKTTANNAQSTATSALAVANAAAPKWTIRREISGNYVLEAADVNALLIYKGTADITVTVPLSLLTADVTTAQGLSCAVVTKGQGVATWIGGAGVTVKHYEEKYRTIRYLPSGLFGVGDGMVIVSNTQF